MCKNSPGAHYSTRIIDSVNDSRLPVINSSPFCDISMERKKSLTDLVKYSSIAVPGSDLNHHHEPQLKVGGHQVHFVAGLTRAVATMHAMFTSQLSGVG